MVDSVVETILQNQMDLHSRISKAHENLRKLGAANVTYSAVKSRINLVDIYWSKFA